MSTTPATKVLFTAENAALIMEHTGANDGCLPSRQFDSPALPPRLFAHWHARGLVWGW